MGKKGAICLAWFGVVISWLSWILSSGVSLIWAIVGGVLAIVGCMFWAKAKGRNWVFGFWGFLAPIGLLGVALLKDKSEKKDPSNQMPPV